MAKQKHYVLEYSSAVRRSALSSHSIPVLKKTFSHAYRVTANSRQFYSFCKWRIGSPILVLFPFQVTRSPISLLTRQPLTLCTIPTTKQFYQSSSNGSVHHNWSDWSLSVDQIYQSVLRNSLKTFFPTRLKYPSWLANLNETTKLLTFLL